MKTLVVLDEKLIEYLLGLARLDVTSELADEAVQQLTASLVILAQAKGAVGKVGS
jgi:hypothetical protein